MAGDRYIVTVTIIATLTSGIFFSTVIAKEAPTMKVEDIDNRFTYHTPKGTQPVHYEEIRETARNFAHRLNELCPESREKSLAITHLEEAVMWANSSIARNG